MPKLAIGQIHAVLAARGLADRLTIGGGNHLSTDKLQLKDFPLS
jgi:hypothetical protein